MPRHIFQEKDYLNYKYFHKRAYYLACIATGLKEAGECNFGIDFALQNGNQLKPVIIVSPGYGSDDFSKSNCKIRILLSYDGDLFPVAKTLPHKNCVRPAEKLSSQAKLPTPFYNASVRSDCSTLECFKLVEESLEVLHNFADASILGSVWLRQRGLALQGFGPFEWACIMTLLMHDRGPKDRPTITTGYSSYQLFKATLQYLASKNLVANSVIVQSEQDETVRSDHPVLFDGASAFNILFGMTPWSYAMLRNEAVSTLKLLNDPLSHHFDACFITRSSDFLFKFDYLISLPVSKLHGLPCCTKLGIDSDTIFCQELHRALKTGLGNRARLIYIEAPLITSWDIGSQRPIASSQTPVQVGLLLDPQEVNRTVDRGPAAEDKEAATVFRSFWGKRAELRRFGDGAIQESLIWFGTGTQESVLKQMISYIIQRHVGDEAVKGLRTTGETFDRLILTSKNSTYDPVTLYRPVLSAFESLEKDIRGLQGLPLQVRQISASSPQLRYASVKAPSLHSLQCRMNPADVCVQFEGSSRWPDDLSAVQRTKVAFLLKIGELLEESVQSLGAELGLEHVNYPLLNTSFLDIIYPSGAFFRLRIYHDRELDLLKRSLSFDVGTVASREDLACALSTYKRNLIQAPLHTQAVRILSTRLPRLSPSMRLMKKWRDSHLLSGHISDELIELLTIRTFLQPYPCSVPASVMAGFLRTLMFIAKWDWRSEPLIVDFSGKMDVEDFNAIKLRFEAWRKIDPAMQRVAIFSASNIDRDGKTWTEIGPSKVVAARFTSLAMVACTMIRDQGPNIRSETLFTASMRDYDFVIHLDPKLIEVEQHPDTEQQFVYKNLQAQSFEDRTPVRFNLALLYMYDLRALFGSSVLFFYNEHDGSVIAGLWNPHTVSRSWKVNLQYSTLPTPTSENIDGACVGINKTATLHNIGRLGGDLVLQIKARK